MKISKLKIRGYKSFGFKEVVLSLDNKLTAFIGLNSAGKTTALEALKKMFGATLSDRELIRQDFHIAKDESPDSITERKLSIEVHLDFSEEEQEAIPHFFSEMVVDDEGKDPYLRIRLEATWEKSLRNPLGEIDMKTFFISVAEGEEENEDSKKVFPNHYRSLIQVLYVPAIRRPAEQLKYVSGSILHRVLQKIKWDEQFKEEFDENISVINEQFKNLPVFNTVQSSITDFWKKFHKDERYKESSLEFGGSDFNSILKKLEISFSPTGTHKAFGVDELGEGYRSLFYLTLVCSLLDVEEKLSNIEDDEVIGQSSPLLTILAIEEPENHIAPQLLGRVTKILKTISEKENSQVVLSSHTSSIVKRVEPESILHFRITKEYYTEVNQIQLPEKTDEAYKYIKEAIHNYPEVYFARLVVIGEGDSEEVIFNRLMNVMDVDFDDNIITFAPLGHRFVNHIWKLLKTLNIPYITLLDLDRERDGGGWGRVKYALKQLLEIGVNREELLAIKTGLLSDANLNEMHTWDLKSGIDSLNAWINRLKEFDIFYSSPLDLDFLMLAHYPNFYKSAIPKNGGPQIPDKVEKNEDFIKKLRTAIQATLKSENAIAETYSEEEKELMIWYNYHFLGRGKPTTHIQTLSSMTDDDLKNNMPPVFSEIFERISTILNDDEA